jgi:uncharacterized membrane protein
MVSAAPAPGSAPAPRLQSIDALRGAIMIIMAIDHIRDYVNRSAMQFLPTDLTRTTPALFFTRWITHFCAPVFILTAGLGAFLWMSRGHRTRAELSRFLVTRGLWLILIETTILRAVIFFQFAYRGSVVILLILWAIGLSMLALAGLAHLPTRLLAALSIAIIVLHNLTDSVGAQTFGRLDWLWKILHQQGVIPVGSVILVVAYPVLPWIGVIAAGFCLGTTFQWDSARRRTFLLRLGWGLTIAFMALRAINIYGDPAKWTHQPTVLFTVLSFLNTTKYPPSLLFLLMTLGPALIALAYLDGANFHDTNPMLVFGRVPFFFYAAHFALAHAIQVGLTYFRYGRTPFLFLLPPSMGTDAKLFPPSFGYPLWTVFAVWLVVLVALYPACLWFSRLKRRRHDWWLSYL